MSREPPHFRTYFGDGVYGHFDGYQVWLTTLEGMAIALEPGLPQRILDYEAMIHRHYAEKAEQT